MTRFAIPALVCLVLSVALPARQEPLAPAQKLYASAQYEDALKLLDQAMADLKPQGETALQVELLRALCLLALERTADAQQAIEAILDVDPLYQLGEDDAAPKVRTAFREVRRRALPGALQRLYARAKQAYDRKLYADAAADFKHVRALLDDGDLTLGAESKADMTLVTQAFLDLSVAATTPPAAPAAPAAPPLTATPNQTPGAAAPAGGDASTAPAQQAAGPAARPGPALFDVSSPDVIPPSPLRTDVPVAAAMRPPDHAREVVVEVIVGVDGLVESTAIRQAAGGLYDGLVLRAARDWRYRPATRQGTPVRFRMLVKVVIDTRG